MQEQISDQNWLILTEEKYHYFTRRLERSNKDLGNYFNNQHSHFFSGLGIAVRHIESILRMSEASAKMALREYVRGDDIDFAIGVLLDSFIQSQKYTVGK